MTNIKQLSATKRQFKIDTRKLRKALNDLMDDVDAMEKENSNPPRSHLRGMGGAIGTYGNYLISIDIDEFDCPVDDFGILSQVITEDTPK